MIAFFAFSFVGAGMPLHALADASAKSIEEKVEEQASSSFIQDFTLSLDTDVTSNLYELDSSRHQASSHLWVAPGVPVFSKAIQVSGLVILTKPLTQIPADQSEQVVQVSESLISVRHSGIELGLGDRLVLSLGGVAVLPFTEDRLERQSMILGVKVAPRLVWNQSLGGVGKLQCFYELGGTQNFHHYTTRTTGQSNVRYQLTQRGVGAWSIGSSGRWTLQLDGQFISGWSYEGGQRDLFSFSQSLQFSPLSQLRVFVGHSNAGSRLAANGVDSNLAVFDSSRSEVWAGMGITL